MPTTVVPTVIPVPPNNIGVKPYKLPDYKVTSEYIISKNDDDLCWQHAAQYSRENVKTCADLRVDVYKYEDDARNEMCIAVFVVCFLIAATFGIIYKIAER